MPRKDLPQKLKIAIISPKFSLGSASSSQGFVWPILRQLAAQGHQVHVLAWTNSLGEPIVKADNVQVSFVSELKKSKNILEFPRLIREVFLEEHRNSPYHILHSLTRDGFLLARERKQHSFATAFDIQATSMAQLYSLIGMSEETPLSKIRNGFKISYTFMKNYLQKDRALLSAADAAFVTSLQQKWILERY